MPADFMVQDADFEEAAASLSTIEAAKQFVGMYGTHFISRAEFGGMLSLNTWVESKYAKNLDSRFFKSQVEASFAILEAPLRNKTENDIDIDEDFKNHSERSLYRTGGDQERYNDKEDLPAWRQSVADFPGLLNATEVYSIADLVPAESRRLLSKYIAQYLS